MENNSVNYNFVNGVASLKEGATPLDEGKLRDTRVFAKLMLSKGNKFVGNQIDSLTMFLMNEKKTFIRAELFVVGSRGQIITDNRVFVNVNVEGIKPKADPINKCYAVELVHPSFSWDACEDVVIRGK